LKGVWVQPDVRDEIVDYIKYWNNRTEIPLGRLLMMANIPSSKFYDWRRRYGTPNRHNAAAPRDWWLEPWEVTAICDYKRAHPLDGYRRLTYMMLDENVVAVAPTTTFRVLRNAGLLYRSTNKTSLKGTGFKQPAAPHRHWHIDISYINLLGTFFFLISLIDGYSRYIVHHELRTGMEEYDVEITVQRALEKFPGVTPRIISDNGSQFISGEFKGYIKQMGLTHMRTSVNYPQANGKIEAWHKSLKCECVRCMSFLSLDDARRKIAAYVDHYNNRRLHSAIGYIAPKDKLEGREEEIFAERDRRLEAARERRKQNAMRGKENAA